jgi:aminoglycoside phosphotransferase (APT) family kinase protein
LRRPPKGAKAKSAHDMLREAHIMSALKPHYPYVPAIVATCEDESVIGQHFFVMERLRGIILRSDIPGDLALSPENVRTLCTNFVDRLIDLHKVDTSNPRLQSIGRGEGYIARQVGGWSERWHQALTEGTDACEDVLAWLAQKQPASDNAACVIHNDFRFDNVVLDPERPLHITGVLDWELATIGDPLMDLGSSLAYWVQADDDATFQAFRRQPSNAPGMLTRREVVGYYGKRTGWSVDNFDFYEVFGLFRLMVIIQQIYRRVVLGQTTNPQFAGFGHAARYMGNRCRNIIARSVL